MKAYYIFFILLFLLEGCIKPQELKLLNWNDNAVRWSVINGGATTSFLWEIYFQKNSSKHKKLIFKSYSEPYITDISISGDYLIIHCSGKSNHLNLIQINLKKVEDFIDNPVNYRESILERTNDSYHEPEFIRENRDEAIKYGLSK